MFVTASDREDENQESAGIEKNVNKINYGHNDRCSTQRKVTIKGGAKIKDFIEEPIKKSKRREVMGLYTGNSNLGQL